MKRMLFVIPWSECYRGRTDCDFANYSERVPEGIVRLATYLKVRGNAIKIADMQCIATTISLHDWTNLGMLKLSMYFGNMTSDRYAYWELHFRKLKRKINNHEGIDE